MSEITYQSLSTKDRLDSLRFAAEKSGLQANLLEKDIWVVQALATMFDSPFGNSLTFKGGTSLSKVYKAIKRFSEDIDITYNIRAIAPDLGPQDHSDPLPATPKEGRKWRDQIGKQLSAWINEKAYPTIYEGLSKYESQFSLEVSKNCILVHYEPLSGGTAFVGPPVRIEFGARSTGEPRNEASVKCDAAEWLPGIQFPNSNLHVMLAERTFWEKATAAHVFCLQKRQRGDRQSRHWYDLVALDDKGLADNALSDIETAVKVALHKNAFFPENDSAKNRIQYLDAVSGKLQLVPEEEAYELLARDYQSMLDGGMIPDTSQTFQNLMIRCKDIQNKANDHHRTGKVSAFLNTT